MIKKELVYIIDIKQNGESVGRSLLEDKLTLGSDDNCDIVFPEFRDRINSHHLTFKLNSNILSMYVIGKKSPTILDDMELLPGKMFILESGDQIRLAGIDIVIRMTTKEEGKDLVATPPGEATIIRMIGNDLDKNFGESESSGLSLVQPMPYNKGITEQPSLSENISLSLNETKLEKEESEVFVSEDYYRRPKFFQKIKDAFDLKKFFSKIKLKRKVKEGSEQAPHEPKQPAEKLKLEKKPDLPKVTKSSLKRNKKKKLKVSSYQNYGFFKRIYALFLHLSFIYFAFYYLDQQFKIFSHLEPLMKALEPHVNNLLGKIPLEHLKNKQVIEKVKELLTFEQIRPLICIVSLDVFIHLILGRSLPQAILGLSDNRSFTKSRIVAPVRAIIHYILLPFSVFHSPIILGKRTFPEFITFTYFDSSSSKLRVLGPALLAPVLILGFLFGPLLSIESFYKELKVQKWKLPKDQKELVQSSVQVEGEFSGLGLGVKTSVDEAISYLPQRTKDKKLLIINKKSGQFIKVETLEKVKLEDLKENLKIGFPYVELFFPRIYILSQLPVDQNQMDKEVEKVVSKSVNLNAMNSYKSATAFGPFLLGPYKIKEYIYRILPKDKYTSYSKIKLMKEDYFLIKSKKRDCFVPALIHKRHIFCVEYTQGEDLYNHYLVKVFNKLNSRFLIGRPIDPAFTMLNIEDNLAFKAKYDFMERRLRELAGIVLEKNNVKLSKEYLLSLTSYIDLCTKAQIQTEALHKIEDNFRSGNKKAFE